MLRFFPTFCGTDVLEKSDGPASASRNCQKAELFNGFNLKGIFKLLRK